MIPFYQRGVDILEEYIELGEMKVVYKETGDLAADIFTKPLPLIQFIKLRNLLMGGEELQLSFDSEHSEHEHTRRVSKAVHSDL